MLMLFLCIAVGFALRKGRILPDSAGQVMSKLETYVFCPALNFITMAQYCTVQTLSTYAGYILFATCATLIAIGLAILIAPLLTKNRRSERGIYRYALAFANSGYMGDPLILALFGTPTLALYKIYTLALNVGTYTWGITQVMSREDEPKGILPFLRKLCNPPMISLFLGMAVGLCGAGAYLPAFAVSTLNTLKGCLGPVAMLLVGFTVAGYSLPRLLKKKAVYVATALRLTVLPAVIVCALWGIKTLAGLCFGEPFDHTVLFLCFFTVATPLGLNTVIFPEAYGGNPEPGAAMALISHTLCVLTIPLLYALMTLAFGVAL